MSRRKSRSMSRLHACLALLSCLAIPAAATAQHIHRNNFEANKLFWTKTLSDVNHEVVLHSSTDQGAHTGQRSEYLQLKVQNGTHLYYQYPIGKAPVSDELNGVVWIKANRPGVQLMARIILPRERDPKNLEAPLTTLIRGDVYQNAGRWQRVSLGRPMQLVKQQQQLLQAELKRSINFTDAYLDMFVLNVFAGPGPTEVWMDDLEVGPVLHDVPAVVKGPTPPGYLVSRPGAVTAPSTRPPVEFNGTHLLVGGKPFFMRGIRVTDTPLKVLQMAGFNTVFLEANADPKLYKEAAELGFWIVPHLPVLSEDSRYSSPEALAREAQTMAERDGVLFLHLGRTLEFEQAAAMQRAVQIVRQADPGRPLGGDVWDGLNVFSRSLNLVAIHRWPLMTSLELPRYREWLELRRRLMNPGTYVWTWIQTHVPDWNTQLLYGQPGTAAFREAVGPSPEQIRLLAYSALASGSKGLAFWSDRFLADSHQGRDRLLECALLNQELEMLEPMLAGIVEQPQWIATSSPDVKAAVLRTPRGVLVLPMWQGNGAQFVPGQAALARLSIVVPQIPGSMQAWEVLPGEVRGLKAERVTGGTKITLPEFGLTTAIAFTSDTNLLVRFQEQARNRRQQVAQWTYDLAAYSLDKVMVIDSELQAKGLGLNEGPALVADAKARLDVAKKLWDTRLFSEAYRESQRSLRPTRILTRMHWDKAVKGLDTPVASPYAVSFYTLVKHAEFMEQFRSASPGPNVLPSGNFESVPVNPQESWKIEEPTLDDVEMLAIRVSELQAPMDLKSGAVPTTLEAPKEGKQCAMLQTKAKNRIAPPQALERTMLALSSPPVKLPPGTPVQVSAWIRIPAPIAASPEGALFYDTAGGEPLAVRLAEPTAWKKITLYRRVPATGHIAVTLALTGLGTVYFDDVRIEPLAPGSVPGNLVSNPR